MSTKRIILSLTLLGLFASNTIQSMEKEASCAIGAHVPVYKMYLMWAKNELANNLHALHNACRDGDLEMVQLLIEAGADVNAENDDGWTPLHEAAWESFVEVAQLLIEADADVNVKNNNGFTPLHKAVVNGRVEIAKLLIEAGADANAKAFADRTPLHSAALEGHTKVAQLLIEAGADVDAQSKSGWTPLHKAAWNGYAEVAKLLLSQVQLPRVQGSPATFTKKDGALEILDLKSLIFLTILEDLNNIEKEERKAHLNSLRSYPDFINILENPSGNLTDFCKHKHLEFIKTFVGMEDKNDGTALDIAVKKKNQHFSLLLAAAGNFLNIVKAADALKDENGVNVLGLTDEDLLKRLQEVIPDLEQKIDENIEEMLTFKILKQEMELS